MYRLRATAVLLMRQQLFGNDSNFSIQTARVVQQRGMIGYVRGTAMKRQLPYFYSQNLPMNKQAREELLIAAAAIANARALRRGAAPSANVLAMLRPFGGGRLYEEVLEDAAAALRAVADEREKRWANETKLLVGST
jgi:predicted aconitase